MNIIKFVFGSLLFLMACGFTCSLGYTWQGSFRDKFFWASVCIDIVLWISGLGILASMT